MLKPITRPEKGKIHKHQLSSYFELTFFQMVLVQPMLLCEHTQSCCYTTSQFPELLDMATAIVFLSLMSCNSRMNACQKSVLHVSNYDNMIHTESE